MVVWAMSRISSSMTRSRMMADVSQATVVITNPTHYAIALRYEPDTRRCTLLPKAGQLRPRPGLCQ